MLLFYDDSPVFGGHEVMTIHAVAGLVSDPTSSPITFFANPKNTLLLDALESLRKISPNRLFIEHSPIPPRKPVAIGSLLRRPSIRRLADHFADLHPHLVIVIQGDIAISTLGLQAAKRAGIPSVSYIPVPDSLSEMGAKFGLIRDSLDSSLFNLPDAFITISESMAAKLAQRSGGLKTIDVVHNGIDIRKFRPLPKSAARDALGIPASKSVVAQVSRIEFNQKRQDFLLKSIARSDLRDQAHLVFAGDGPDEEKLKDAAHALGLDEHVSFIPWQEDMAKVYAASDVLVVPSRFEGFPLVMLESICCHTPVAATNQDGMADFLPKPWLFPAGDSKACIDRIHHILESDNSETIRTLSRKIESEMTLEAFQKNFASALTRFIPQSDSSPPLTCSSRQTQTPQFAMPTTTSTKEMPSSNLG